MIDAAFWCGKRVLLTGHTGFKGAWTALLLRAMEAEVYGLALAPEGSQALFNVAAVANDLDHAICDIRDRDAVQAAFARTRPEIVIHMAAQALVRVSYVEPVETYATNVMGSVHVLEAARRAPDLKAVVVVTSDKCYDNVGSVQGYRETDRLGGHDPYSNSKACAELVVDAYRRSFFSGGRGPRLASARAGNVIGGGDWAKDRLVPDAMRAFASDRPLHVRYPHAVRPWQHVLDPVAAYLLLAEHLVHGGETFEDAWNFGPAPTSEVPVSTIADGLARRWGRGATWEWEGGDHPREAASLKLDCAKARAKLGWRPLIDLDEALDLTVDWYLASRRGADMRAFTLNQVAKGLGRMAGAGLDRGLGLAGSAPYA